MTVSLEISLTVPILTYDLPAVKKSSIHEFNARFGVLVLLEFDLDNSFRVGFVEPYAFNFSQLLYFLGELSFDFLDFGFGVEKFGGKNMFENYNFKSLTLIRTLVILN